MTTERVRVDGHGHERLDRLPDDVLHFGVESADDRGDLHLVVGGWVHPTSQSGQPHDRWMVSSCANYLFRGLFPYSRGLLAISSTCYRSLRTKS